jgi:hypothetical protein
MGKWVCLFEEGDRRLLALLGGKGAGRANATTDTAMSTDQKIFRLSWTGWSLSTASWTV